MARKKERISLLDLKRADDEVNGKTNTKISDNAVPAKAAISPVIDTPSIHAKPAQGPVGEYEKLSVSIPLDTFETLQDISRERRRVKQKHTMSQMVREALELWLEHRNQTNSI